MRHTTRRLTGAVAALAMLAGVAGSSGIAAAASSTSAVVPIGSYVKYSTCGFPRVACPTNDVGKSAAKEPSPQHIGRFVEIGLTQWILKYGMDGITQQPPKAVTGSWAKLASFGQGTSTGFTGYTLPMQFFPSTGQFTANIQGLGIPFLIPRIGRGIASMMPMAAPKPVTVNVPAGHYLVVWLLETGINGSQSVPFQEHYSDGTTQYVSVNFHDWCNGGSAPMNVPPEYLAIWLPYRLNGGGGLNTNVCGGLYAEFLPTITSKTLTSITLSNLSPNAYLMSMTLEKTA